MRPHPVPAGGGGLWGPEPLACEPRGNSTFRPLPDPDSMFDLGRYGPQAPTGSPPAQTLDAARAGLRPGSLPVSRQTRAAGTPSSSVLTWGPMGAVVSSDIPSPSKLRGRNGGHCQKLQASWQLGPRTGRRDIGLEGLVVERRWV